MATGIYAALSALLVILLALRVVAERRRAGVGIGDGGNAALALALRVHANALENLPIALILMLLLELAGVQRVSIHVLGALLVLSRLMHAFGLARNSGRSFGRYYGTLLCWLLILGMAGWLLVISLAGLAPVPH